MWRVWKVERGGRAVIDTFHTWKVWKVGRGGGGDVEGVEGGEGGEHSDPNRHFLSLSHQPCARYSCRCLTSRVHAIPAVVDEASHPRVEIFVAEWLSRTSRTSLCVRWTRVQGCCNMALQGAFECASEIGDSTCHLLAVHPAPSRKPDRSSMMRNDAQSSVC